MSVSRSSIKVMSHAKVTGTGRSNEHN